MTNPDIEALAELRAMLESVTREEGCTIFDHIPEEIGIQVMENYEAVLTALRSTTAEPNPAPNVISALQAIANLPTGRNEDVMEGHEQAYRAVEALFTTPPHIEVHPTDSAAKNAEPGRKGAMDEARALEELALLYNHSDNDEPQFTRWQMIIAMQHGARLTSAADSAAKDAEIAELRATVARVKAAIEYAPLPDMTATKAAIAADLNAGMSLRVAARKHGVAVGTVRGVKSALANRGGAGE